MDTADMETTPTKMGKNTVNRDHVRPGKVNGPEEQAQAL